MSHPFTLKYMREGEMDSAELNVDDAKLEKNEEPSIVHESQIESRSSKRISLNNSVTDGCPTHPSGEHLSVLEKIKHNDRISTSGMIRKSLRRRMEILAEEVSIVGLSYLVKPSTHDIGSIIRKVIWAMLLLFGTGPIAQSIAAARYPPLLDIGFDEGQRGNFSHLNVDWEFFYDYVGYKTADTLLECSFGNLPCHSSDAIQVIKSDLGFCMSFNSERANYVTTQPGANHGLRLVLWVNQSDCHLTASPGVGFRVSMLPSPYGDCRQGENYTYQKCMTKCWMDLILSQCKCRILTCEAPGVKVCSPDQYVYCITKTSQWWISSGASRRCDCPLQCHQPTYPFSISTSPLSQHFLNYMSRRSQFKGRNLTMSKLSKELVYLDIFYSQLSYVDYQVTPAYDILTLVCDIGGALGLILGGTLLTIFEVLQFFV